MDTVPSSADNTDQGETFEDAHDSTSLANEQSPPLPSDPDPPEQHQTSSDDTATISEHRHEDPAELPQAAAEESVPEVSTTSGKPPPLPSRFTGFSANLPSVPWAAPPKRPSVPRDPSPQAPSQGRKITGPFAWLGRGASSQKETPLPPPHTRSQPAERRDTAASVSTIGSNPELMLKAFEGGQDVVASSAHKPPSRNSLRDRFKLLRLREEAGITSGEDQNKSEAGGLAGLIGRTTSLGGGAAAGPSSVGDEKEDGLTLSPVTSPRSTGAPPLPSPTVNPDLAPGTVAGVAASSIDVAGPIDWDFWQSVVNEGPQAVVRTSREELSQAISSGIPHTIRGVIWQVLAESKNDDLEGVYRDLLDKGMKESVPPTPTTNGHLNGGHKEKESVASSASSTHSDHSTPATSTHLGVHSPPHPTPTDHPNGVKTHPQLQAERQAKEKEDALALSKLEKMIKRDMGTRTSYSKYAAAAGFQDGLFNICKAYALFDEAVGYPQGMNFIIMPLLFNMPEEEAFCLLVRLMNKYGLRDLFIQDMPGLHLHLYQFERLLEDLEPALYCHLNRRGVGPKLYATQWFLTLFAYRFPLQLVMRVYDLVLSEGLEGAILKFGMAVVQRNVTTLLQMNDMLSLTTFLKEKVFDVYIDQTPSSKSLLESGFFGNSGGSDKDVYRADLLVRDACDVKLHADMLQRYRSEWDEKVRVEREREVEIEHYRTTLAAHTIKIRSLEERAEKSDTEHVQIATDLVRLKVENQELQDKNESLKGQVEELKKVAQIEAKNVEDRLKGEMDRVMHRNIEVQNENRHMEETMAEMEKDLVETKMKYAEVNESREALLRKLNDFRKALD